MTESILRESTRDFVMELWSEGSMFCFPHSLTFGNLRTTRWRSVGRTEEFGMFWVSQAQERGDACASKEGVREVMARVDQ
jgi:hypothetical protein